MFKIQGAKNDVRKGSIIIAKNVIFFKNVNKNYKSDLKVHDMKRRRFNMFGYFFPWDNVLGQSGEVCLKSIILAVNHCLALLRYVSRGVL